MPGNIAKNISTDSIRDVYRINYLLSGIGFIFSFSYLILEQYQIPTIGIKSGLYILSAGYCQALILEYCALKYSDRPLRFKLIRYTLGFTSGISLYFLFWVLFNLLTGYAPHFDNIRWVIIYIMIAIFLNFIIFALHDFVIIRRAKIDADLENYRLQMQNKEAENLLLKQQIHPHFLFNALNMLNLLYKKDPILGEQYLIRLSDFLRASISCNNKSIASLREELSICKNYLEMQKIRFGNSIIWDTLIEDENTLSKKLPSFSLQPLLENAIKHNALTPSSPLYIRILQYGNTIEISNTINKKKYNEPSLKSGLNNLAERYRLLTGHDIMITNNEIFFSVSFNFLS